MNFSNCFRLLSAAGLVTALITASAHAQTRVGEAAVVKNEVLRVAGPSTTQIKVGDGLVRDETVRTGIDSATRLVMADSTNLSLGPGATLKLDRTVFDDEHHYRDVAVRLTSRVSFRHRQFGQGRLQDHDTAGDHRRPRHHPRYPVAARPDHRQSAGRRGQRLHDQLRMHPAHQARRHRHYYHKRRQVDDQEDQQPALDVCRDLQRRSRALQHHAICGCVIGHRR